MNIPEKEIQFNRYIAGEMSKDELKVLVKRPLLDKELREWFTVQMEFLTLFRDPPRHGL
jgi:hypothetical protein